MNYSIVINSSLGKIKEEPQTSNIDWKCNGLYIFSTLSTGGGSWYGDINFDRWSSCFHSEINSVGYLNSFCWSKIRMYRNANSEKKF